MGILKCGTNHLNSKQLKMIDIQNRSEKSCMLVGILVGITIALLACDKSSRGVFDE